MGKQRGQMERKTTRERRKDRRGGGDGDGSGGGIRIEEGCC